MTIRERMRSGWLSLIKHTLNHLTGWIARSPVGPFAIVRHVGRTSGTVFETPIIVRPIEGGFVIALTYGPRVNWYRNIVAANGCDILLHRVWYHVSAVEPLDPQVAIRAFSRAQQRILRRNSTLIFNRLVVITRTR